MNGRAVVVFAWILTAAAAAGAQPRQEPEAAQTLVEPAGRSPRLLEPASSAFAALGRGRAGGLATHDVPGVAAQRAATAPATAPATPPRRKSARVAMISSFLVPGLGQMYNEREFWAAVAAGVEFYFIGQWIVEQRLTNRYREVVALDPDDRQARVLFELHRDNRIQAQWMYGLSALISGLQALVDAYLYDFDDTPLPVQPATTPSGGGGAKLEFRF